MSRAKLPKPKLPKPTIKDLAARIEVLENILEDLAGRLYIASDVARGRIALQVRGIKEVRGNDGVLLGTINLREGKRR